MELAKQNSELAVISRLKEVSEKQFKEFLLKEYNKLLLKNGQNPPDPSNAGLVANELYNNLNKTWPGVKIEWVQKAFEKGINGDYGDFANISYRLMNDWINKFRYSMKREDFGIQEEPMNTKERASFVLDGLRKRNPELSNLDNKGKEALKRKLNKEQIAKYKKDNNIK